MYVHAKLKEFVIKCTHYTPILKKLSVILAGSIGLIVSFFALLPNINVIQSVPLIPENPFISPFVLNNNSLFLIRNISFSCYIVKFNFDTPERNATNITIETLTINPSSNSVSNLYPKRSTILSLESVTELFGDKYGTITKCNSADIAVVINYCYFFLPFSFQEMFRFKAIKDSNNTFYWMPVYIDRSWKIEHGFA